MKKIKYFSTEIAELSYCFSNQKTSTEMDDKKNKSWLVLVSSYIVMGLYIFVALEVYMSSYSSEPLISSSYSPPPPPPPPDYFDLSKPAGITIVLFLLGVMGFLRARLIWLLAFVIHSILFFKLLDNRMDFVCHPIFWMVLFVILYNITPVKKKNSTLSFS